MMNQPIGNTVQPIEHSARGKLLIAGCTPARYLTQPIIARLNAQLDSDTDAHIPCLEDIDFQFSDSEIGVRLEVDVSGCDVFLLQALYDPRKQHSVNEHYLALCIAARAFREWGAHKVTAVLPYLAYARQDKPTRYQREPTTARLMADLSITAGIDRLITWHPHYPQIHGFYSDIPVDVLEPLETFIDHFEGYRGREDVVIVAPDIGASKFATYLGRALGLQVAIASKYHPAQEQTEITQIIGDLADKRVALVVDDMMSSGGTVYKTIEKLVKEYGVAEVSLAVSHNLCTDQAYEHLKALRNKYCLQEVFVTNSIPQTNAFRSLPFMTVHDLSPELVNAINRIHY